MPLQRQLSQRSVSIVSSVAEVLNKLKLSHHEDSFMIHCINTYSDLQMLKEEQMRELGMWKVGERNRLKRWIEKNLKERTLTDEDETRPPVHRMSAPSEPRRVQAVDAPPMLVRTDVRMERNQITVFGAGLKEVNGVYEEAGKWDGVRHYSKKCVWRGKTVQLQLFRCRLLNDTKRWFIAIVPAGRNPGTSLDTDFYSSPMVQEFADIPPEGGWTTCKYGVHPPPILECSFETTVVGEDDVSTVDSTTAVSEIPVPRQASLSGPGATAPPPHSSSQATALAASRPKPPQPIASQTSTQATALAALGPHPLTQNSERIMNQKVMVESSGELIVNGVYTPSGLYDGAVMYKKGVYWEGQRQTISLFRCLVRGNERRWYISIVPDGQQPGTSLDTDYYSAPVAADSPDMPPRLGWTEAGEGSAPPPKLVYLSLMQEGDDQPIIEFGRVASLETLTASTATSNDHTLQRFRTRLRVDLSSLAFINGIYTPTGTFDGVPTYTMRSFYKGRERILTLFRCLVKDKTKRWYISIVPSKSAPGTVHDVDFYTAPSNDSIDSFPPQTGWVAVGEGRGTPPVVYTIDEDNEYSNTLSGDDNEESKDDGETQSSENDDELERTQTTPKASGARKSLKWNPLGMLTSKDSKRRLMHSGVDPERIGLPPVVTVNGQSFRAERDEYVGNNE